MAVAAKPGRTGEASRLIEILGGKVRFLSAEVDYLAISLPVGAIEQLVASEHVQSATIDLPSEEFSPYTSLFLTDPKESKSDSNSRRGQDSKNYTVDANEKDESIGESGSIISPLDNQYEILRDLSALSLRKKSPTFDGRGVVIAHVEGFPDFLAPELQVAYDIEGRQLNKFVDIVSVMAYKSSLSTSAEPLTLGAEWFELVGPVFGSGRITINGEAYQLPHEGNFRFSEFIVPNKAPYQKIFDLLKRSYRSAGNGSEKEVDVFSRAMIWSQSEQSLRIDLNNDHDFRNDDAIVSFPISNSFGVLGRDDPKTPVRETIGFAVRKVGNYLSVMYGVDSHASMVAGAAAASHGVAGKLEGIAPGAQLLSIAHGKRATSFGQAMIVAFSDPRVDVVLIEGYYSANAVNHLKDGSSALAVVLQRLVRRYNKPVFFTAFNAPGMSTSVDTANGSDVLSIGAYHSSASILANNGAKIQFQDNLHWTGAEGPSGNGSLKPDFLAPANPISIGAGHRKGSEVAGAFVLPPGYRIGAGTSTATPVAAGVSAMLISAAKQTGTNYDAGRINHALRSTARFLPQIPAYKQGTGLIQVDSAWKWLSANANNSDLIEIQVDAPVRTATSRFLETPNRGVGLFEREGWRLGQKANRVLYLTRQTGPVEPIEFDVGWVGNISNIFSSENNIVLPLGTPVPFQIVIDAKEIGDHSALLEVKHENGYGAVAHVPVTIVVPYELNSKSDDEAGKRITFSMTRPGRKNLFVRVPEGVEELNIAFSSNRDGLGARIIGPANLALGQAVYLPTQSNGSGQGKITFPDAGVWQITFLERSDMQRFDQSAADLDYLPHVEVRLSVSVDMPPAAFGNSDTDGDCRLRLQNNVRSVLSESADTVENVSSTFGLLEKNDGVVEELYVEPGTSSIVVGVSGHKSKESDLDLYLYDCSIGNCRPARLETSYSAYEQAVVSNPAPGLWKAVVFSADASNESVCYLFQLTELKSELSNAKGASSVKKIQ